MGREKTRLNIIAAADDLIYRQGYEPTSFAHIARATNISRGNFYYHFKAKDEILTAVIEARLKNTRAMLAQWEQDGATPQDRIQCFINILVTNGDKIRRHGCPVGSLTLELAKLNHDAQGHASLVFAEFRSWLRGQFQDMGMGAQSDHLALHLLSRSQGVAILSNALGEDAFVQNEVSQMTDWLNTLTDATGRSQSLKSVSDQSR